MTFQNCGSSFQPLESGGDDFASLGSFTCESSLFDLYKDTYYPLLSSKCTTCHTNGPGLGQFGSVDLTASFTAFQSMGRARIEQNAVNPNHHASLHGTCESGGGESL